MCITTVGPGAHWRRPIGYSVDLLIGYAIILQVIPIKFPECQPSTTTAVVSFIHSYSFINTCQNASTQINAKVNKSL